MQINAPFNAISARRARDLLGVTDLVSVVPQITLKVLGFIGDGNSHPLRERFGSVPQAQEVYPRATSLDEEIDGHAIQRCIDLQHDALKPVVVHLPPGCYGQLSFPIQSGKLPTLLVGENSTLTQRTPGADGWVHGSEATGFKAHYGASFRVRGVKMSCLGQGGTAFYVQQNPTSGYFIMTDVNIVGSGDVSVNYWARGVVGIGTSYTTFTNVSALGQLGGDLRGKLDAMFFTVDANQFPNTQGAFIYRFIDCDISWYGRGYNFDIPRTMEGVWFERGNINSCPLGIRLWNTTPDQGGGIASPQYFIDGMLLECWSTFFEMQSMKFVNITGCTLLLNGPKPEFSAGDYLWPWMKVGVNTTDVMVYNNHFEFFAGARPLCLLDVSAIGTENIEFHNNHFRFNPNSGPSYLIKFGEGQYACKNVKEYDNVGLVGQTFSSVVGAAQRSNGNFSKSSIASSLLAAGDTLVGIDYNSGIATVNGYRVVAPGTVGSARIANLSLPAGVLTAAPRTIHPFFADDAGVSAGETLATSAGLSNANTLAVNVVGYNGSGARRIGFTVVG